MSIFTPHKTKHKKRHLGSTIYIMNKKVLPVYVDSGEKVDGENIGIVQGKITYDKIDISKYINSFASQCGVENVIRMFNKTGDLSLFRQNQVIENVDATKIPDKSLDELYKDIPEELKGDKDVVSFIKTLSKEQLVALAKSMKAKAQEEAAKAKEVHANE